MHVVLPGVATDPPPTLRVRLKVDGVLGETHEVWFDRHGDGLQASAGEWPSEALPGGGMAAGTALVGFSALLPDRPDQPRTLVAVYASGERLEQALEQARVAWQLQAAAGAGAAARAAGAGGGGGAGPSAGAGAAGGAVAADGPAVPRSLRRRASYGEDGLGRYVLLAMPKGRVGPVPDSLVLGPGPLEALLPALFVKRRPLLTEIVQARLQVSPPPSRPSPLSPMWPPMTITPHIPNVLLTLAARSPALGTHYSTTSACMLPHQKLTQS